MIPKTVLSSDGGKISYRQAGKGPGLILVHGGMETWRSHKELGSALANAFTVYLPDRRGRGTSSPPGPDYSMQIEVNDIEALARATGARLIFGISSGALISLEACLKLRGLFDKAVLYEAPVLRDVEADRHERLFAEFEDDLNKDDLGGAMMTGINMTGLGPMAFKLMPKWVGRPVLNYLMSREDSTWGKAPPRSRPPTMRELLPTMRCDFSLVKEMAGALQRITDLYETEVLMLSGTLSPPYLIRSTEEITGCIPGAKHSKLEGLGHTGSGNKDNGGQPDVVADVMRDFLRHSQNSVH